MKYLFEYTLHKGPDEIQLQIISGGHTPQQRIKTPYFRLERIRFSNRKYKFDTPFILERKILQTEQDGEKLCLLPSFIFNPMTIHPRLRLDHYLSLREYKENTSERLDEILQELQGSTIEITMSDIVEDGTMFSSFCRRESVSYIHLELRHTEDNRLKMYSDDIPCFREERNKFCIRYALLKSLPDKRRMILEIANVAQPDVILCSIKLRPNKYMQNSKDARNDEKRTIIKEKDEKFIFSLKRENGQECFTPEEIEGFRLCIHFQM